MIEIVFETCAPGHSTWKILDGDCVKDWNAAKEAFRRWVLLWLDQENSDAAIDAFADLVCDQKPIEWYSYDSHEYRVREVSEE